MASETVDAVHQFKDQDGNALCATETMRLEQVMCVKIVTGQIEASPCSRCPHAALDRIYCHQQDEYPHSSMRIAHNPFNAVYRAKKGLAVTCNIS